DRVLPDGGADGARGFLAAHFTRDVGVGRRAPERDREQRLPDFHLEVCPDQHHAQRSVCAPFGGVENALRIGGGCRRVFHVACIRPSSAHVVERGFVAAIVGEGEAA